MLILYFSLRTDATGNSDASEGTPLSLHQLHEASAPNLLKTSLEEPKRGLSLSKFGNMAFSDEESAGTTPFSTRDSAAIIESSNMEVSSVAATAGSPENVPADTASNASGPLLNTATDEQTEAGTAAESGSHKTNSSNDDEGDGNSSSKANDKPKPLHLTPKQGPLRMARRKSTSPATLPADMPLEAGKSPMPTGGTVRRLSTYASAAAAAVDATDSAEIATRTPFNSTVTPSAEAAAAVAEPSAALNTIKEEVVEGVTVPITSTEVESTVEAGSDTETAAIVEEGEDGNDQDGDATTTADVGETTEDNKTQGRKGGKNRRKGKGKK